MIDEFKEIAHGGGKVTFNINYASGGEVKFNIRYSTSRPVPIRITGIYALPDGRPVANWDLGGLGQPDYTHSPPPISNCYPVFVVSDSEGHFGHNCPECNGYWRSGPHPNCCPYCGIILESYKFLSKAQNLFISHYCKVLSDALECRDKNNVIIDLDAVADAVNDVEKPAFNISEESQQNKFNCHACNQFNDIIGKYGYCSNCCTRHDIVDFEKKEITRIRRMLNEGDIPSDCLRAAVAAFDSYMTQGASQLHQYVPMTNRRRKQFPERFHNIEEIQKSFSVWFDINLFEGLSKKDQLSVTKMFHRRHVYEHNGGVVDQRYLDQTNDRTVRLNQHIKEDKSSVHEALNSIVKMAKNFHLGFHELLPPLNEPIKCFAERKNQMTRE